MATVAAFSNDAFIDRQGETKSYDYVGQSGKALSRHFCANCGSRLFTHADLIEGATFVAVGSMDDPNSVEPQMHIFTAHAASWTCFSPGLPQFEGMPN